jgi:hypothetical protein
MPAFTNLLVIGTLGLGLFQLSAAAPPPAAQLHIDQTCSDASSNLQEYVLYTYPENTSKCITIGAPGFPFSSTDAVTQCGDYTNGGAQSTECNNYPRNALSVTLTGSIKCTFFSSEDCTIDDTHPGFGTLSNNDANGACQDFPPQLPLSGGRKQSASSLTCSNA